MYAIRSYYAPHDNESGTSRPASLSSSRLRAKCGADAPPEAAVWTRRGETRENARVAVLAAFLTERHPLLPREIRHEFPADRRAHPIDNNQQDGRLGG